MLGSPRFPKWEPREGGHAIQTAIQTAIKSPVVKLANFLDPGMDAEIPATAESELRDGHSHHRRNLGAMPPPDEEPGIELYAAIKHTLAAQAPPFADLSALGPRSLRRKKMRLLGYQISSDGTLEKQEGLFVGADTRDGVLQPGGAHHGEA